MKQQPSLPRRVHFEGTRAQEQQQQLEASQPSSTSSTSVHKMAASALPTLTFPSVSTAIPTPFHGPLRRLLIRALRLCPLPKHVAFIMDGNRRAARMEGVEVIRGHEKGFEALKGVSARG